jgi:hypothetical protein
MNIGTLVWRNSQGNLRIGTVTGKELDEKGWAHFTVDWHDDVRHRMAVDRSDKLRKDSVDSYARAYRVDELTVVDPSHLDYSIVGHIETLSSLKQRVH